MKHRLVALTAVVAVAFTGGCSVIESAAGAYPPAKSTAAPTPGADSKAGGKSGSEAGSSEAAEDAGSEPETGHNSVKDAGDIPDPCTLLSEHEVTHLTGREISQIDEDGLEPGEGARFCQWQQSGGQLAVFLSRTTAEDFTVTVAEAEWVDGVGEDAFWHSGHLYVLYGTVQIDVYSRGADSDTQNLADAKRVAEVLIPRV
jgi:hypothetical protein